MGKRFPRPRGDGPREGSGIMAFTVVPPPTRGWSFCWSHADRLMNGSPAHAGMVPWRVGQAVAV